MKYLKPVLFISAVAFLILSTEFSTHKSENNIYMVKDKEYTEAYDETHTYLIDEFVVKQIVTSTEHHDDEYSLILYQNSANEDLPDIEIEVSVTKEVWDKVEYGDEVIYDQGELKLE